MIKFYYHPSPNPAKVALFLEESGCEARCIPGSCSLPRRAFPYVFGDAGWTDHPHVKRFFDRINARPAAQRAEALKDSHAFKTAYDQEALEALYPQNALLTA